MKKYLYLLIACTMMCFAGCEEKGDEIDNTTDTGENVEINEANLVGTWELDKWVDKLDGQTGKGEGETLKIKKDGTFVHKYDVIIVNGTGNGTWSLEGNVLILTYDDEEFASFGETKQTIIKLTSKELVLQHEGEDEGGKYEIIEYYTKQ